LFSKGLDMAHGSSMTRGHKGMRSGISLVEMLIAIVLFGVISTIGYKYYKNFYDTTLAAKKARVAAIVDQATQISNAYDIYNMQKGTVPITMAALSDATTKILTQTPPAMPEISTSGWKIADPTALADRVGLTLAGTTVAANDTGFTYILDAGTAADQLEYCNILNNMANSTWSLDSLLAAIFAESVMYPAPNNFTSMMCYNNGGVLTFAFVKTVDLN
jgi:prepilin-type N-terminal cleavage/methylation domain-containing protein